MLRLLPIFALILCLAACGGGGSSQSNSSNGSWYLTVVNPNEDHLIVTVNPIAGGSHTYNLGAKEERLLYPGTGQIGVTIPGVTPTLYGPIDSNLDPIDAQPGEQWSVTWDFGTSTIIWTKTVIKSSG